MHKTEKTLRLLCDYESRNVTFIEPDGSWPIVWERAKGVQVWDAEGKRYLDLTSAFGVAAAGHANPRVVRAGQRQMSRLLHAMGDVHPHSIKAELARELSKITFERWSHSVEFTGKTIFCNSGFEAVEAALKTAMLATGKRGVISFAGGYHGLGYGALNTTHRKHFSFPFRSQLGGFGHFVSYPAGPAGSKRTCAATRKTEGEIRQLLKHHPIGAILVEPIQARGGMNIPSPDFLPMLRRLADASGILLIVDEIYTGFGRTGKWFACEHSGILPDLICLGKALTGGFPLSACVGRVALMDAAWPASTGEAIHTSTFLGHPVGCAMALAQIAEIEKEKLVPKSASAGNFLLSGLESLCSKNKSLDLSARGLGLMAGLEIRRSGKAATGVTLRIVKSMLRRGFILLPEGERSNVIGFTPPLTISRAQIASAIDALAETISNLEPQ